MSLKQMGKWAVVLLSAVLLVACSNKGTNRSGGSRHG